MSSPCYLPSLGTAIWAVLLFLSLSRGALILLYVEDHLQLVESVMCNCAWIMFWLRN